MSVEQSLIPARAVSSVMLCLQNRASNVWLGALATTFFALHAATQIQAGMPANLLWACHFADLCVAVGLLFRCRTLCGAGVLLLVIGVPLWLINLAFGGTFYPTSILTHIGGLVVGVMGLRKSEFPKQSWLAAVGIVAALLVASRAYTSPSANINLAFEPWRLQNSSSMQPEVYVLVLLAGWTTLLWSVQQAYFLLRFAAAHRRSTTA